MTLREALETALANLRAHKLRSALAMLGIIFGVGAVIAMLAIGAGGERQAMRMIEEMGVRNLLVRAKKVPDAELQEVRKKSLGVSLRDGEAIREAVPGIELVVARVDVTPYKIFTSSGKTEGTVSGVSFRQPELSAVRLEEGRFLDALDEKTFAAVCVLGSGARRDLFGFGPALGRPVKVNDVWLEVVGILAAPVAAAPSAASGASGEGSSASSAPAADRRILLPVSTAMRKFDRPATDAPVDELVVRLAPSEAPGGAATNVRALLDRLHGGAKDYEVVVPQELLEQSLRTQRLFKIVMGSIAGISLLVGGIGITNIMLASVLERIREIGVRRALGARRKDVMAQFVLEAFTLSSFGGFVGILLGVALARAVAAVAGWPTVVTAASILLSTGVSIAVGLVAGLYPASRAAKQDPIEALRYE